tara:strand:- start:1441 stop:1947 length:507 start_codon:yes stop_codon:yes gene_type:complete
MEVYLKTQVVSKETNTVAISEPRLSLRNPNISTVQDALKIKGLPSVGRMAKDFSPLKIHAILIKWLMEVNRTLSVKDNMSEDQVQLAATYIMEDHKSLNVSDLIVIFKDIIKGKYGKMYGSWDLSKLLTAIREYEESRMTAAMKHSTNKHAELKSNTYIGERTSEQRL